MCVHLVIVRLTFDRFSPRMLLPTSPHGKLQPSKVHVTPCGEQHGQARLGFNRTVQLLPSTDMSSRSITIVIIILQHGMRRFSAMASSVIKNLLPPGRNLLGTSTCYRVLRRAPRRASSTCGTRSRGAACAQVIRK